MSYDATVYNVMIASPSDVKEERQTIREAIFEWNYKNSRANGMVLMPLGWETHSAERPVIGISGESLAIMDDTVPVVSMKVKELVNEILRDPKGQLCVSRLKWEKMDKIVIETNGKEYTDREEVLTYLEKGQWIRKLDGDGRVFSLTDLGYQEAAKLISS